MAKIFAKLFFTVILGWASTLWAQSHVTGAGPGAGTGVIDPTDVDHNTQPMEPGAPPNPKPTDGAIIDRENTRKIRMKRNVKSTATTTTTTIVTTTTLGTFR